MDSSRDAFRDFIEIVFIIIQCAALGTVLFLEIRAWGKPGPSCAIGVTEMLIALMVAASSLLVFGFLKRPWVRFAVFLLVLLEAFAIFDVPIMLRGISRDRLELSDPARTIADARELIRTRPAGQFIDLKDLPPSLRIPQVYRVQAHGDHLDLITDSHPDGHRGFRIWSEEATRPREEQPTKYTGITLYFWHNDVPMAPDNMP